MKRIRNMLRQAVLAALVIALGATAAMAQAYQPTTLTSTYLSFDGAQYSLSSSGYLVDAGGFVAVQMPGGSMIDSSGGSQIISFSLLIPLADFLALY